jgi:hypothetical protein
MVRSTGAASYTYLATVCIRAPPPSGLPGQPRPGFLHGLLGALCQLHHWPICPSLEGASDKAETRVATHRVGGVRVGSQKHSQYSTSSS